MTRKAVDEVTRTAVLVRAEFKCEYCYGALNLWHSYSVHHRLPRGMGGTKGTKIHQPSYLLVLCGSGTSGCHGFFEQFRRLAKQNGIILYRIDKANEVPFRDKYGKWWLIDDNGQKHTVATDATKV